MPEKRAADDTQPVDILATSLIEKGLLDEAVGRAVGAALTMPFQGHVNRQIEHVADKATTRLTSKVHKDHPVQNVHVKGSAVGGHLYSLKGEDGKTRNYRVLGSSHYGKEEGASGGVSLIHEPQKGEPHQPAVYMSHEEFKGKLGHEIQDAEPGHGTRAEWWNTHKQNNGTPLKQRITVPGKGKMAYVPRGTKVVRSEDDTMQEGEPLEKSDMVQHLAYHLAMNGPAIATQVHHAIHQLAAAHIGDAAAQAASHAGEIASHVAGEARNMAGERAHEILSPSRLAQETAAGVSGGVIREHFARRLRKTKNTVATKVGHEPFHIPSSGPEGSARAGHDYAIHHKNENGETEFRRYHAHVVHPTEGVHLDPKPFDNSPSKYSGMMMSHKDFIEGRKKGTIHDLGHIPMGKEAEHMERSEDDQYELVKADTDAQPAETQPKELKIEVDNSALDTGEAKVPMPDSEKYTVQPGDVVLDLSGHRYVAGELDENKRVPIERDGLVVTTVSEPDWYRFVKAPGMSVRRNGRKIDI